MDIRTYRQWAVVLPNDLSNLEITTDQDGVILLRSTLRITLIRSANIREFPSSFDGRLLSRLVPPYAAQHEA